MDLGVLADGDAAAARGTGEAGGHQVGVGKAGFGLIADQGCVFKLRDRQQFFRLLAVQQLERNALVLLLLQRGAQRLKLVAFRGDDHVATLHQSAGRLFVAKIPGEIIEHCPGMAGQFDVLLDRVMGTEDAGRLGRRSRTDVAPVEHQDVLRAKPGQMKRYRAADDTGADHHYVVRIHGCTFH